jgi:hypothetical protein
MSGKNSDFRPTRYAEIPAYHYHSQRPGQYFDSTGSLPNVASHWHGKRAQTMDNDVPLDVNLGDWSGFGGDF